MLKSKAEALRRAMMTAADALPDDMADTAAAIFEPWNGDSVDYKAGDRRRFDGVVYKCLQDHKSQPDWTPTAATSLWARAHVDVSEWVQPTGAADAYNKGDKVKHKGKVWISNVGANVWEPGVYGWTED